MKRKNKLSKIALTALIIASSSPMISEAADQFESHGTLLAAKCAAHGCAAASSSSSSSDSSKNMDSYGTGANTYHIESSTPEQGTTPVKNSTNSQGTPAGRNQPGGSNSTSNGTNDTPVAGYNSYKNYDNDNIGYTDGAKTPKTARMNYGADQASYETYRYQNDRNYQNDRYYQDANRQMYGNPNYNNTYRGGAYETSTYPYGAEYGDNTNFNQPYQPGTRFDYRGAVNPAVSTTTLTEAQLQGMLSPEGRAMYGDLTPTGKATALQLASQDSYRDKNQAVMEAARRTSSARPAGAMSR